MELAQPAASGLPGLLERCADRRTVVLASGDPLVSGIGTTLIELLGPESVRVHPAVSSVALARARMGWDSETVRVVTVVGRDLDLVRRQVAPGQRLVVLSSDADDPGRAGPAADRRRLRSEHADRARRPGHAAGEPASRPRRLPPTGWATCRPSTWSRWHAWRPSTATLGFGPGLPDDAYEHDGQLTKRDLRASALSRLAPVPGELLWDLGAGAGSIAIEWARTDPRCRAIAVDRTPDRAARIAANAARLGVPGIQVITADVVESLDWLPQPDAVFVGGGADLDLIRRCWHLLPAGGRLVAHAVTTETEQVLLEAWRGFGGELVRIAVEKLEPWVASPAGNPPGQWSSGARSATPPTGCARDHVPPHHIR